MLEKIEKYHNTQIWFSRNKSIFGASRHQSLLEICTKISEILEVKRVGVWFFTVDKEALFEEMTYTGPNQKSQGLILLQKDCPKYFNEIIERGEVVVPNTFDEKKREIIDRDYVEKFKLTAFLNSAIYSDGELIGILCCGQTTGNRDWDINDINFISSMADLVGRVIEAEKRYTYEKELKHRINYLENDLKKKLDALNEAKLSLDLALESTQVGKWDWDIQANKFILNKTWYTKLGYEENELPQGVETFRGVIHPDDVEIVFETLKHYLREKVAFYECRYRMLTKTKEIQWVLDRGCINLRNAEGVPLSVTGVSVNITPIVKWEQSLSISEQQLKAMIQSLPTPVAMFDKDLNVLSLSSKWKDEWKLVADIKEGDSVRNFFRKDWIEKMEAALKGVHFSKDDDLVEIGPGEKYWIRWVVRPWQNSDHEIGGVVIMAENITEKKESEIRLTQASKFSALGEMAGGIAHEINNPLGVIKGYVDLLRRLSLRKTLSAELLLQYIDKVDKTIARISRIVSGMKKFSRESSLDERIRYHFNKIVEETLDICQERINNNGTAIEVEYLNGSNEINCRPVEISQVLLNLINNSFQATYSLSHPWIKIKMEDMGDYFKMSVIDSGDGIPAIVRQKLFQPFFTTKEVGTGTGLGLSISKSIIEEHKGRLYYQDNAVNTTFVVELPKLNIEHSVTAEH